MAVKCLILLIFFSPSISFVHTHRQNNFWFPISTFWRFVSFCSHFTLFQHFPFIFTASNFVVSLCQLFPIILHLTTHTDSSISLDFKLKLQTPYLNFFVTLLNELSLRYFVCDVHSKRRISFSIVRKYLTKKKIRKQFDLND